MRMLTLCVHVCIYRADHANVNDRLTSMISKWLASDTNASWESLADALNRTPDYGPATVARFRRAVGMPGEEWTVYISFVRVVLIEYSYSLCYKHSVGSCMCTDKSNAFIFIYNVAHDSSNDCSQVQAREKVMRSHAHLPEPQGAIDGALCLLNNYFFLA